MTIYGETIPYVADSIIALEEMGIFFSANVVFEDIWGDEENKKKLLGIYKEQLLRLVDYYLENPHLEPVKPLLGRALSSIGQDKGKSNDGAGRNDARFCGAGHDMVMVDVDGQRYPCHRFSNWIAKRAAPTRAVNRQKEWKPAKCASCKFVSICPTCVGFNWEVEGDESVRTTYHCEALKLEVLAAAKLNAERLERMPIKEVSQLPKMEAYRLKRSLEVIMELNECGITLD